MMKYSTLIPVMALLTGLLAPQAQAMNDIKAYVFNSSGLVVKSPYGDCVRADHPGHAEIPECGGAAGSTEPKPMVAAKGDADKDGVIDSKDQCPDTDAGVRVDARGCALDSDGDGVADSSDQCADTAAGIAVDRSGCPLDSDGDGVLDAEDRCADSAPGAQVNAFGCAVDSDDDGDGIANQSDACPGTAKGTAVDLRGCELKEDIRLDNVQFRTGTAELSGQSRGILDNIARVLIENKHLKFEVGGHTDDRGDYQFNVNLSKQRAESVRNYLIEKGVAADRLSARGYGPDMPLVNNDTAQGRSQNRRVELKLQ